MHTKWQRQNCCRGKIKIAQIRIETWEEITILFKHTVAQIRKIGAKPIVIVSKVLSHDCNKS
jgi:hypothetical protein